MPPAAGEEMHRWRQAQVRYARSARRPSSWSGLDVISDAADEPAQHAVRTDWTAVLSVALGTEEQDAVGGAARIDDLECLRQPAFGLRRPIRDELRVEVGELRHRESPQTSIRPATMLMCSAQRCVGSRYFSSRPSASAASRLA